MADDKSKKGPQNRDRINISEEYEVRYWSKKFGVTPDQLRATVRKVGNTTEAVERELKKPLNSSAVQQDFLYRGRVCRCLHGAIFSGFSRKLRPRASANCW
jgi:hypothetical protein